MAEKLHDQQVYLIGPGIYGVYHADYDAFLVAGTQWVPAEEVDSPIIIFGKRDRTEEGR